METYLDVKAINAAIKNTSVLSVHAAESRRDPTKTLTLRNQFAADASSRFIAMRGAIRQAVDEEDVLGLKNPVTVLASPPLTTPGPEAFKFQTSGDKVKSFMDWVRTQQEIGILEVSELGQIGTGIEGAWTNKYIRGAYQRGIERARSELRKVGVAAPTIAESGGIASVFNQPVHLDRAGLLFTRTFEDLKGITAAMDQQLSRVLAEGMANGLNPRTIARQLTRTISGPVGDLGITDTLGRFIPAERRAKILARTEVVRAHHKATIQEYRNFGVAGVKVTAEFRTAGDKRVCPDCEALEGDRFTLDQAESIIPVHAQCRCIFIPITVN